MGKKQSNPLIKAANAQRARRNPNYAVRGTPGSDRTVLRYNCVSSAVTTDGAGEYQWDRTYVPGLGSGIANSAGVNVASFYATGVFRPGTTVKWVPYVGFQTSGRLLIAFTDNPEIMAQAVGWTLSQKVAWIRGSSNGVNMPLYEERTLAVPTNTRRKRFDVNQNITFAVDTLDRSAQVMMITAIVAGPGSTTVGQFEYHDVLDVEGLNTAST